MDATIISLECANEELCQAGQLQALGVKPAPTATWDLSEKPAQKDPDVQQKEAQRDQHEAVGGILRGRPAADLAGASVARFDAEAAAVLAARLVGRPVQLDENEDHPVSPSFHALGALGGGEHTTNRQFSREGRLASAVEGIPRPITFVPLAQRARAAGLAPDRAGDFGRLALALQILHQRD